MSNSEGRVESATRSEIARLHALGVSTGALGALALELAAHIDASRSAQGAALAAKQLRDVLDELWSSAPPGVRRTGKKGKAMEAEVDELERIRQRRAKRGGEQR